MLIGIDVGGTTTDAVLLEGSHLLGSAMVPTDPDDLSGCLLEALDALLTGVAPGDIHRVVLSTTVITNLIAEGKADPVGLILIPGPGTNPRDYPLPPAELVDGAIDFRGREIRALDVRGVRAAGAALAAEGLRKVAVVGKFSQRNHSHELQAERILAEAFPELQVELGHRVSGRLNFPRRAATTLLTVSTRDHYRDFAVRMAAALRRRGLQAPVHVLKADGGTVPLEKSVACPVETIFSGPAASAMGALALGPLGQTSVVVDVGGTTTDMALILSGRPLLASKGAQVDGLLTHVRTFAVKSVGLGGDSAVRVRGGALVLGPDRLGPAACLGGPAPTPTDALRVLGLTALGDAALARGSMEPAARSLGLTPEQLAEQVLEAMVAGIVGEIEGMFTRWEQEPVYRIWELLQKERIRPQTVMGVGGASPPLVPLVAERLGARPLVSTYAAVANAIGAAAARPTLTLNLSIDTAQGTYVVAEDGEVGRVEDRQLGLPAAEQMARRLLLARAQALGVAEYADQAEVTYSEVFNMVRGWSQTGRLLDVQVEIPAGLIPAWKGGGGEF